LYASRSGTNKDTLNISPRLRLRSRSSEQKFIVRGGAYQAMEGHARERNVVVEFKDRSTAFACYQSLEYEQARTIRQKYAEADFIIIDGVAD
jgi:uncharacterized protein (DUF1330 family)